MIRQAGGHILVESETGRGTTFKILLPREGAPANAASIPPVAAASGGHETILFVEDEAIVRTIGVRILREHGYTVLEASSGGEALRMAAEHDRQIDLLMTDVVMPHMSGVELARRMRAER
jgi:CheY-like chemotaxis protein